MNRISAAAFALLLCCVGFAAATLAQEPELAYTAKPRDTLIGIARDWLADGERWSAHLRLARHNRIADPDRIRTGREIRIPLAWLRRDAVAGVLSDVQGTARSGGIQLAPNARLAPGAEIQTGRDGYVTVELADGSKLVVQPETRLSLNTHNVYRKTGAFESLIRLLEGAVEATVARVRGPGARFEVNTGFAAAAVRGTEFRVRTDARSTRSEVLDGAVYVAGARGDKGVTVRPGFGTVVDASQVPLPPVRLLPAPDLRALPALHERVLMRLRFGALPEAEGYRVQLAADAAFTRLLRDERVTAPEARYAGLADGYYHFRARGIDRHGIEGSNATARVRLKARPEPPFPSAPANKGKLRGERAEFTWSAAAQAARYRFELARDPGFTDLVVERADIAATRFAPSGTLAPAEYYWRLASIRADGDQGPFGDPQRFALLPLPANPEPPSITDDTLRFTWSAEPGQSFRFQLAHDPEFTQPVRELALKEPAVTLKRPDPGTYYMRVQATDADGFVGPYTAAQRFELPEPPFPWWLLLILVPLL